jgi:16S rRNA (cytidine1402-2'-O)-methyltransferase
LAKEAVAAGITVVPVPGANAALCALVASGQPCSPFFFGGFLPKSRKNRKEKLEEWQHIPSTIVLYEAPHRIREVLKDIEEAWGDRNITLARELTKLHEEFFRGNITTGPGIFGK